MNIAIKFFFCLAYFGFGIVSQSNSFHDISYKDLQNSVLKCKGNFGSVQTAHESLGVQEAQVFQFINSYS